MKEKKALQELSVGPRQRLSEPGVVFGAWYGLLLGQGCWKLKKMFPLLSWICLSYSEPTQR